MTDRGDELEALEAWAGALLRSMEPAARGRLLRRMVFSLRRSQVARIQAQRNPDGSAFAPRKKPRATTAAPRPIRFLYRKAGGDVRVADLRSWRQSGDRIIGYDREAEGIRTFRKSRIQRHLPAEGETDAGAMPSNLRGKGGRIRSRARSMFQRIRSATHLKSGVEDTELWVGFTGRAARIAGVHQFGLRDRVRDGGPEAQYPQRRLLGFTQEDREAMMSLLLQQLTDA